MPQSLTIDPVPHPIDGRIQPPGSKSLTNRALMIAAMADGISTLRGVLHSDDTRAMIQSLQTLGVELVHHPAETAIVVHGTGGQFSGQAELSIGNSGTSIRFLTAMLGFHGGHYRLDGVARMRERPIGPLVDALAQLGAGIRAESPNQCPPVAIDSQPIQGGSVELSGNLSSQYLSGLLMAAPLATRDVELSIVGELVSRPYVEMTCQVMDAFGVAVDRRTGGNCFGIAGGQAYRPAEYTIEPDASAASYFWAAAAILGGRATVLGLDERSLQGDVQFVRCLEQMGCDVDIADHAISVTGPALHGIEVDMGHLSDTVQTLSAVALFVQGSTTITRIAHNRVKETDRIGNLAIELRKLGADVEERPDGMTIHPGPLRGAEVETYDDHRMAMSLSLVGLRQPGVVILDPGCVSKTYPDYFRDLQAFVQGT